MHHMTKFAKIFLVLIIFAVVVGLVYKNSQKQNLSNKNPTLKIGGIIFLTGPYSAQGEEINRGALIAVEEAKQADMDVEYIPEDDAFTNTGMVNAANKVLKLDRVDAAFVPTVTEVKPIYSLFNAAKIPLLAVWDSNNLIKGAGDYVFTIGFNTEVNAEKIANYAYDNLKVRRIAVISQIEDWSEIISSTFVDKFSQRGGQAVLREKFQLEQNDFRTVITKAKNLGVDAVYFPLNAPANGQFLKQADQLGLKTTFLTGDGFIEEEIQVAGMAAENVYLTHQQNDNIGPLVEKYRARYGKDPYAEGFVAFGYDAINTLVAAKKIALQKNINLRDALTQVDIQGAGSHINMKGNRYSDRVEKINQIVNGKYQLIERP